MNRGGLRRADDNQDSAGLGRPPWAVAVPTKDTSDQHKRLDVSTVGTLPDTEPERTIAHVERLSVLLGLPAPEGRWRYLRDVS